MLSWITGSGGASQEQQQEDIPSDSPPEYDAVATTSPTDTKAPLRPPGATQQGPPGAGGKAGGPPMKRLRPLDLPAINVLRGKRVILASRSPRRRALLAQIGLKDIEVIPSDYPEDLDKHRYSPLEYVTETATQKCMTVYRVEIDADVEPAIVLSADTVIVSHLGAVIEKPLNAADHFEMLKSLRDSEPHRVFTAVCAMSPLADGRSPGYSIETHVEETIVKFDKNVTDELIQAYIKTGEGVDKAGGYGIQGIGAVLVESINGSYDNVVGLPLRGTLTIIEKVMFAEDELSAELGLADRD